MKAATTALMLAAAMAVAAGCQRTGESSAVAPAGQSGTGLTGGLGGSGLGMTGTFPSNGTATQASGAGAATEGSPNRTTRGSAGSR
ncbi:MAG: hypothetical protein JWQ07_2963 [Ramlibacter sp.]|nr:hypothetical protein [Ramlibacter sp.]